MEALPVPPPRLRVAIALSIAVHLCALMLLHPLFGGPPSAVDTGADAPQVYPVSIMVFRTQRQAPARTPAVREPRHPVVLSAAAAATPAAQRPRQRFETAAVRSTAVIARAVGHARRQAAGASSSNQQSASVARPVSHATRVVYLPVLSRPTPAALPSPVATPAAAATPSPVATPTAAATIAAEPPANFSGLFSQNYPPALPASTVVQAIRSRLGGHGRIRVDVDETGHATGVHFLESIPQDAAQDVREQLLGATYVPADCNGLRCDGALEITY